MNHSDAAALADHFRDKGDEFADYVLRKAEANYAITDRRVTVPMERDLLSAFENARSLDENAPEAGRAADFLQSFINSVFCDGFIPALVEFSRLPVDQKANRPILEALRKKEDPRAAQLLVLFREKMKLGWSVEDALRYYGEDIGLEFAKGNARLLEKLAHAAREAYSREFFSERTGKTRLSGVQGWILQAWLPLALWQNVAADELEQRLKAAWEVTKAAGLAVPDWPAFDSEKPYAVANLIAKARSSIKLRRR